MKQLAISRFLSIPFVALVLAPSAAHLLELPNTLALPADAHLTVQQIYRGWALLGIVIVAAVLSTAMHGILLRLRRQPYAAVAFGLACLLAGQVVFEVFTYPANRETMNWTVLAGGWTQLRARWEYSHAVCALLNFTAFVALLRAALRGGGGSSDRAAWGFQATKQ